MKSRLCLLAGFFAALAGGLRAATTPIRIEETTEAQFPAALASSPVTTGEVRLVINVDADGRLADLLVAGYTDQAFAVEALRLLKEWRYTAATVDGKPVGARLDLRIEFSSICRVISLSRLDSPDVLNGSLKRQAIITRVCPPRELDRPMAVVQAVSPPDPAGARPSSRPAGATVLDFYVDENGRARMPVVMAAPQEIYAQAAVWALNQWRFTAPTRAGKPVVVRVRQEFVFPADVATTKTGRT